MKKNSKFFFFLMLAGITVGKVAAQTSAQFYSAPTVTSTGLSGSTGPNFLRIITSTGNLDLGSQNTFWCHLATDRDRFYFNKPVFVSNGEFASYSSSNLILKTGITGTTGSNTRLTILNNNGYTGIGTSTPVAKLHVSDPTDADGIFATTTATPTKIWAMNSLYSYALGVDANGTGHMYTNINNADGVPFMHFSQYGRVWIGNPALSFTGGPHAGNYEFAVKGKFVAQEIYVTTSDWADYVFKPGYQLKKLEEVETYIQENGHLPNVPSEKEIEVNGNNLADTDRILLEKIEELTLYIIDQNKKMNELELKLNALSK